MKCFYKAAAVCNCVFTEIYLAINCALSEYTPSANDVLRVFTARPRCVLRTGCVHKTFFTYWKDNVNLYNRIGIQKKTPKHLQLVKNDTHVKIVLFWIK